MTRASFEAALKKGALAETFVMDILERKGWVVDPAEEIDVRRDGKPVFDRCLTVETWAGLTVSEDGDRDPRFRPYRGADAPHRGNSALRVSHPPEDETPVYGPSVGGVV